MTEPKPLILAIDDTPSNLLLLGMALQPDFELQIATSGEAGLALAAQLHPDLILLDIMMPGIDGFETCRRLKADPVLMNIPVVFVSALAERESAGFALGAADYIAKPVNVEIARQRIRNLLERETLRKNVTAQRDQLQAQVAQLHAAQRVLEQTRVTLAASEAHLNAIILNEPECIKIVDGQGRLVQMNPAGLAMIEADSPGQVIGQPLLALIAPEHREAFLAMHQRVLGGESTKLEFEIQGLKGTRRWLETHAAPLQENGQTVNLAVTRDVTQRKLEQQRLERLLHEQKAITDNELVGMVKTANRTIVWTNRAFEKMLGYEPGEMVGLGTQRINADDASYAAVAAAYPVLQAGGIFRAQIQYAKKNGERIWVDLNGAMLDHDTGECLWMLLDITNRVEAEDALKQQLRFTDGLHQIAQAIIDGPQTSALLQQVTRIAGQTLGLDRALMYQVSFEQDQVMALHEWLNPLQADLQPNTKSYPLSLFNASATEMLHTQHYLASHRDAVHPLFLADGSAELLHQRMGIQSLLWYPFDWSEGTCVMLGLYQVFGSRVWSPAELDFVESLVRQVNLGLSKIRLLAAQRLAQRQIQLAASVFSHVREGIIITAPDGTIIDVNEAFTSITGYARSEALGQNPRLLKSGRHDADFYASMWQQLTAHGYWHGELWNRRKNGEIFPETLTITAVHDDAGQPAHYVAMFSDITAFKAHQNQLDQLAYYDPLTQLPNRTLLADRMRQSLAAAQRHGKHLVVVFLDLDGFKAVNDSHGHDVGDQLLVALSNQMKQALREGDTLARIGGDEFVAVLGDLAEPQASVLILTRLLAAASEPLMLNGVQLQVSASIGASSYPQPQELEADQLLRQADQAMYRAKLSGKNRFCFFDVKQDAGQSCASTYS